jgi:hypothetical protein
MTRPAKRATGLVRLLCLSQHARRDLRSTSTASGGPSRRERNSGAGSRPGRRAGRLATATAIMAALAVAASAGPAAGAGAGAGTDGTFGITPVPAGNGRAAPYFTMALEPGETATATAIVTNRGQTTEQLRLSRATGVTAANGGTSFSRSFQGCSGPGCWVTGLLGNVTLAAGASEAVRFTVHVPTETQPGQYLAGLTGELATKPPSAQVGSNGQASARAIIVEQVAVAVVVTVGALSAMTTRLRIPDVRGTAIGSLARLNVLLDNTGQTFTRATGNANCTVAGRREAYTVVAATVLPHDHATIPANAPGLPEGSPVPCTVRLAYGNGQIASWAGLVSVPVPPKARVLHTGLGAYAVIPAAGTPAWAVALIIIAALALGAMIVLLRVHVLRRRRSLAGWGRIPRP